MTLLNTLSLKNELIEKLESENACLKLALSANNEKWVKEIKKLNIHTCKYNECDQVEILHLQELLSQMKEGE